MTDLTDAIETRGPGDIATLEREAAYWAAFARVRHIGPARIARLVDRFRALEIAWWAPEAELRATLEPRALSELLATRRTLDPEQEADRLRQRGIRALFPGQAEYPRLLAEASGHPSVLYIRGELTPEDATAVGIVGTRRSTPYGRHVTAEMSESLARAGITVVSGLARGVDAVAHATALEVGGRTVAVLGSGVDVIYPAEHRRLAERVLEQGAIVSEQPPGAKPDAPNFPARNRIISGMSLGVVVIEAPMRSGALITATFAADQGRDVFVVPGNVGNDSSEGTNQLLRDGARLVRNGADVLADLNLRPDRPAQLALQMPLDPLEARIISLLGGEPLHIDDVADAAAISTIDAAQALLLMELKGLVRNCGAQFYVRK
ncbi:MAG: DNA-processing protein DprA [Thermomicrobiales bacterium]